MGAGGTSETLITTYQTAWQHNPETTIYIPTTVRTSTPSTVILGEKNLAFQRELIACIFKIQVKKTSMLVSNSIVVGILKHMIYLGL
jgi:hypothetical protein